MEYPELFFLGTHSIKWYYWGRCCSWVKDWEQGPFYRECSQKRTESTRWMADCKCCGRPHPKRRGKRQCQGRSQWRPRHRQSRALWHYITCRETCQPHRTKNAFQIEEIANWLRAANVAPKPFWIFFSENHWLALPSNSRKTGVGVPLSDRFGTFNAIGIDVKLTGFECLAIGSHAKNSMIWGAFGVFQTPEASSGCRGLPIGVIGGPNSSPAEGPSRGTWNPSPPTGDMASSLELVATVDQRDSKCQMAPPNPCLGMPNGDKQYVQLLVWMKFVAWLWKRVPL